ncbi:MAG TPA: hypothetical protein VHI11_14520 [Jiangellaceae bacterium]|jgi:hypothetical protein|nr:hypothetical protein [Jiangellaceae bacterium]
MELFDLRYAEQPPRLVRLSGAAYVANDFVASFVGSDLPGPVTLRVLVEDARSPRVTEISVTGRSLTGGDLRKIPLARLRDAATTAASFRPLMGEDGEITGGAQPIPSTTAVRTALRRSRRPIDQEHLTEVADVYDAAETRPTQAVADRFGVPRSTAARWVWLARRSGFLPPAERRGRDPR